jgi:hypothetical protein
MTRIDAHLAGGEDERAQDQARTHDLLEAFLRDPASVPGLRRTAERYGRLREDVALDLVWEVLGDVPIGETAYDAMSPLGPQLHREVRRRASRLRRGEPSRHGTQQQPSFVSLDMAPATALTLSLDVPQEVLDPEDLVFRIRELARDDTFARQLLDLYDRGLYTRRAGLRAGLTERSYRSARQRLRAYAAVAMAAVTR